MSWADSSQVCTFEDCNTPDRTYESRREWFSHELQEHRRQWSCIEGCQHTFHSQEKLQMHLKHRHAASVVDEGLKSIPPGGGTHQAIPTATRCPLCQSQCSSLNQLRSHLGKHQRELSLFAIPSSMHEEEDSSQGSCGDTSNNESESVIVDRPLYECIFWFLPCKYIQHNGNEWRVHCSSHFHGEVPPSRALCPLCEWNEMNEDGNVTWKLKLQHLEEHFKAGHSLRGGPPDFHLITYLWQKRLIDDHDLKILKGTQIVQTIT